MAESQPLDFLKEKDKEVNVPINLVILEVSKAYFCILEEGSTKTELKIKEELVNAIATDGYDITESGDGWCWVVSFERGNNNGTRRVVKSYSPNTRIIVIDGATDNQTYSSSTGGDKIRLARCVFLAQWNMPVNFYLYDKSKSLEYPIKYMPFPMAIEPVGTTTTGEIMGMKAQVSNVNKLIGNAIQQAGGLRGNRITHIIVFDGLTDQGKDFCLGNVMYIDSVTITATDVQFTFESRFNVLGIDLPLCSYNRDFCRWVYGSEECGWRTSLGVDTQHYPLADATWCDHSLRGSNGCVAHFNNRRFGGFPALVSKR